jgi:hypothetical protein
MSNAYVQDISCDFMHVFNYTVIYEITRDTIQGLVLPGFFRLCDNRNVMITGVCRV